MKSFASLLLARLAFPLPARADEAPADAAAAPPRVDNFALLDHEGRSHELDYYPRMPRVRGIVLFVHGVGCPLVQRRAPELMRLRDHYQPHGLLSAMLNANPQDGREEIARACAEFGIDMPVLVDDAQFVATMPDCHRTAEAFVIRGGDHTLAFRGPGDDRLSYQKEKPEPTQRYLADALDALIEGRPVSVREIAESPGLPHASPSPTPRPPPRSPTPGPSRRSSARTGYAATPRAASAPLP